MAFVEKPHHHKNARALLGLVIVVLAFCILLLFVNYKDNIVAANAVQPFVVLTAVGLGLMAGLFYLANQTAIPSHKHAVKHVRNAKRKRRK